MQESMNIGLTNLVIAITSLVTAIGVIWVNIIAAKAKARVNQAADTLEAKAEEINTTTKVTLGHVNSAAAEMKAAIDALQKENALLKITAAENREIAAVLAAHAATHQMKPPVPQEVTIVNEPTEPVPIVPVKGAKP